MKILNLLNVNYIKICLYVLLFFIFFQQLLPENILKLFLEKFIIILFGLFFILSTVTILNSYIFKVKLNKKFNFSFKKSDVLLFLFPGYLFLLNKHYFLTDNVKVHSFFFDFLFLIILIILKLLFVHNFKKLYFSNIVFAALLILTFIFIIPVISFLFDWNTSGSFKIQILFIIIITISYVLYILLLNNFFKSLIILLKISLIFAIIFLPQLHKLPQEIKKNDFKNLNIKFNQQNNVYLLSYCSYVSDRILRNYGINNLDQEKYLFNNGFSMRDVYTRSIETVASIGQVLDMKKNNELVSVLGFNSIIRLFKQNNYKTFAMFETPFYFNRNKNYPLNYNFTYPKSAPESVLTALLKGDFKRKLYKVEQNDPYKLLKKLSLKNKKNSFFYIQDGPYPSSKSGKCNFNQEVQSYKERLKIINIRMKKIINHIINFDKNSIIIIIGDHGPSFLNNCGPIDSKKLSHKVTREFLLDNYGAFLAYRFLTVIIQKNFTLCKKP